MKASWLHDTFVAKRSSPFRTCQINQNARFVSRQWVGEKTALLLISQMLASKIITSANTIELAKSQLANLFKIRNKAIASYTLDLSRQFAL